jgi:RNA polymerase sigma-70 factor, ECF subfamily
VIPQGTETSALNFRARRKQTACGVLLDVDERKTTVLNRGAQDELRAFYDAAYGQAWAYLSRMCWGDTSLIEDLVQDVMVSVARHLGSGRSASQDSAWIVTVSRNHFLNHVRSVARADARLAKANDRSTMNGSLEDTADIDVARSLLAHLPIEQRAAVALRHIDGYSVPEIADKLGRSVEATESLIARGVRALRQLRPETN